jgi:hypothetical protein
MKKQSFTLLLAVLFLVKGIAQQVEQQQRSLVTKRTATWCINCGTWGWTFFKDALEDNGDKAIFLAAHYDGALEVGAATDITNNFGGASQPRFYLGNTDQGVSSSNLNTKLTALKEQIDANFDQAPVANSGFQPIFADGEIKVDAKVKFFLAAQGEYHLGIYLVENNVTANQTGIGANAVHQKLLRASFTTNAFGQLVSNTDITAGQEFNLSYSLPLDEIDGHEYEVIGIIWKKEGSKYIPVNVWGTDEISTEPLSGIYDKLPENKMVVAPNIISNSAVISIDLIHDQLDATVELYDLNGRLVATLHNGAMKKGNQLVRFDKGLVGGTGTYFIKLKSRSVELLEKVVIQ